MSSFSSNVMSFSLLIIIISPQYDATTHHHDDRMAGMPSLIGVKDVSSDLNDWFLTVSTFNQVSLLSLSLSSLHPYPFLS